MENVNGKFLETLNSFECKGGVLVALSGGADSVCLLDLFLSSGYPYKIAAAHLNHNLRGEESDRDEQFCRDLCKSLGVELFVGSADVNALAEKSGKGVEEAARSARYEFLQSVVENDSELSYIATAHNRDDLCETVLLNLARGAGLDGMCAIPERRGNIIRPILKISRAEILTYNKEKNLEFVTDSTNFSSKYSRNRVRLNILPEFGQLFSGFASNFERTVSLLRRDAEYLNTQTQNVYEEVVENGVLYTKKAQNVHLSLLSRIVRKLYNYYGFFDIAEVHIDAVCQKIQNGAENFTLSLPACYAVCERGKMFFTKELKAASEFCLPIKIGESILLPNGVTVCLLEESSSGAYPIRRDALCGKLLIRSRKEGDTVTFFGKTHKVKRIISDKKLSAAKKAKLFFLTVDDEIVYTNIPATADKAFARRGDDVVYITVKENDNE